MGFSSFLRETKDMSALSVYLDIRGAHSTYLPGPGYGAPLSRAHRVYACARSSGLASRLYIDHTVHNVTVVNIPNCMVIVATRNPGLSHFQTQAYGGLNRLVSPDSV